MFRADNGPCLMLDTASLCDIGSFIVDGVDIAPGKAIPDDGDSRIHRALEGFMFTCGPDHIRHPQPIPGMEGRQYPLHGSFSSHPADIVSVTHDSGTDMAQLDAISHIRLADGGSAILERRWQISGHCGEVTLKDRVTNTGDRPFPLFIMYHINLAGRLPGGTARLEGDMLENGGFSWQFGSETGGVFCVPAAPGADMAEVSLGPLSLPDGKRLYVKFATSTLPFLQVWRNQKFPCDVIGIEPVSHRLARRGELEAAGEFDFLSPGEGRNFSLSFRIS